MRPKWCWPIRLQDFKSNISLEQSDEIVYFLHVDTRNYRKILGGCGQKWLWPPWLQGEFVHELSWFFASWCKFWKVMNYFNNVWEVVVKNWHGTLISEWIGQIWVCPFQSQDSMICCISIMNELSWFFACSYMLSRKLKVTLGMHIMVKNGIWSWSSWNSKISFISTQK